MLALDNSSFFSQLLNQAYPAKPAGLGLSDSIFYASLNPLTPLAVSLIYLLATKLANSRFKGSKNAPRDIIKNNAHLERAVVAHNVFLCLYSAWTSVEVFKIMASYFGNGIREGGLAGEHQEEELEGAGRRAVGNSLHRRKRAMRDEWMKMTFSDEVELEWIVFRMRALVRPCHLHSQLTSLFSPVPSPSISAPFFSINPRLHQCFLYCPCLRP